MAENRALQFVAFAVLNDLMKLTGSDLHLLSVFDAVARNGGFTAAQVELGLSQPTISNHITALEQRLGVKLCQRGRRGFILTEKGRIVQEVALALIESLGIHSAHLSSLKGNLVGQLRVGVVDCVSTDREFRLPEAIQEFTNVAPAVRIDLGVMGLQDVLNGVLDGSLHVGIGSFDTAVSGIQVIDLYDENHTIYCGSSHPMFGLRGDDITAATLRSYPRVHRGYWRRQRQKSAAPLDGDRFVHEIEAQLIMVLSGSYLGLLPDHLANSFVAEGRLHRLAHPLEDYICKMQLITRAGAVPQVNRLFMDTVVACYA